MTNKTPQPETDEQTLWLQEIIIENTPGWAHLLAMIAQFRGMRWMRFFPLPIVRKLTDVTVKTDTNMKAPPKGFRPGTVIETQTLRVYKRGRLIAEKEFNEGRIIKSPFSKIA